ncbi:MAG: hypothetical protein FJ087_02705 [Deltaproteobacteria bacterium]|nr:hypothetical protein [Deltaproteobacteria bacterium]
MLVIGLGRPILRSGAVLTCTVLVGCASSGRVCIDLTAPEGEAASGRTSIPGTTRSRVARLAFHELRRNCTPDRGEVILCPDRGCFCTKRPPFGTAIFALKVLEGLEADITRYDRVLVRRQSTGSAIEEFGGGLDAVSRALDSIPANDVGLVDFHYSWRGGVLRRTETIYVLDARDGTAGMVEVEAVRRRLLEGDDGETALLVPRANTPCGSYELVRCRAGPSGGCPPLPPYSAVLFGVPSCRDRTGFALMGEVMSAGWFEGTDSGGEVAPITPAVAWPLLTAVPSVLALDGATMCIASVRIESRSDGSANVRLAPGERPPCADSRPFRPSVFFFPPRTETCSAVTVMPGGAGDERSR